MDKKTSFKKLYDILFKGDLSREFLIGCEKDNNRVFSAKDYQLEIEKFYINLKNMSNTVSKGSYVGIMLSSNTYWLATFFAVLKNGFIPLLIDSNANEMLLNIYIKESNMKFVITSKPIKNLTIDTILLDDLKQDIVINAISNEDTWANKIVFCTSGTTGTSKLIVYYASSVCDSCINLSRFIETNWKSKGIFDQFAGKRYLSVVPMHHILGFYTCMATFYLNVVMVYPRNEAIFTIMDTIKEQHINICVSVPMFWNLLRNIIISKYHEFNSQTLSEALGKDLKVCISGGAKTNTHLIESYQNANIEFMIGYGMTEVGVITISLAPENLEDCEGTIYPWFDFRVKSIDNSSNVGELLLKGDSIFYSYLKDGKEIPWRKNSDDYFPTGDIFEVNDRKISFRGRCKNMILNDSGENIYPEELEEYFKPIMKFDLQYCIIEQENKPIMVIHFNKEIDEKQVFSIIADINSKLPIFERIPYIIVSNSPLPITSKLEVKRRDVLKFLEVQDNINKILMKGLI